MISDLGSANQLTEPSIAVDSDSAWLLGGGTTGGMLQFNMSSQNFTSISTANFWANGGDILNGAMLYVPSFGPAGILVAMGGSVQAEQYDTQLGFQTVSVFDLAKRSSGIRPPLATFHLLGPISASPV